MFYWLCDAQALTMNFSSGTTVSPAAISCSSTLLMLVEPAVCAFLGCRGLYFLRFSFWVWLTTVRSRKMNLQTPRTLEGLDDTLLVILMMPSLGSATFRPPSCFSSSILPGRSQALNLAMAAQAAAIAYTEGFFSFLIGTPLWHKWDPRWL